MLFFIVGYCVITGQYEWERAYKPAYLPVHNGHVASDGFIPTRQIGRPVTLTMLKVRLLTSTLGMLVLALLSGYALIYLHMFDVASVAIASCVGLFDGLFFARLYYSVVEPSKTYCPVQTVAWCCCLDDVLLSSN